MAGSTPPSPIVEDDKQGKQREEQETLDRNKDGSGYSGLQNGAAAAEESELDLEELKKKRDMIDKLMLSAVQKTTSGEDKKRTRKKQEKKKGDKNKPNKDKPAEEKLPGFPPPQQQNPVPNKEQVIPSIQNRNNAGGDNDTFSVKELDKHRETLAQMTADLDAAEARYKERNQPGKGVPSGSGPSSARRLHFPSPSKGDVHSPKVLSPFKPKGSDFLRGKNEDLLNVARKPGTVSVGSPFKQSTWNADLEAEKLRKELDSITEDTQNRMEVGVLETIPLNILGHKYLDTSSGVYRYGTESVFGMVDCLTKIITVQNQGIKALQTCYSEIASNRFHVDAQLKEIRSETTDAQSKLMKDMLSVAGLKPDNLKEPRLQKDTTDLQPVVVEVDDIIDDDDGKVLVPARTLDLMQFPNLRVQRNMTAMVNAAFILIFGDGERSVASKALRNISFSFKNDVSGWELTRGNKKIRDAVLNLAMQLYADPSDSTQTLVVYDKAKYCIRRAPIELRRPPHGYPVVAKKRERRRRQGKRSLAADLDEQAETPRKRTWNSENWHSFFERKKKDDELNNEIQLLHVSASGNSGIVEGVDREADQSPSAVVPDGKGNENSASKGSGSKKKRRRHKKNSPAKRHRPCSESTDVGLTTPDKTRQKADLDTKASPGFTGKPDRPEKSEITPPQGELNQPGTSKTMEEPDSDDSSSDSSNSEVPPVPRVTDTKLMNKFKNLLSPRRR